MDQHYLTRAERQKAVIKSFLLASAATAMISSAMADPVDLSAYVDEKGFLDVQKLTCAQLANTYQEDANALMSWYSGWYNGLAHRHFLDFRKGRETEHLVIEHCKAHPEQKIIHAISIVFHDERAEEGVDRK